MDQWRFLIKINCNRTERERELAHRHTEHRVVAYKLENKNTDRSGADVRLVEMDTSRERYQPRKAFRASTNGSVQHYYNSPTACWALLQLLLMIFHPAMFAWKVHIFSVCASAHACAQWDDENGTAIAALLHMHFIRSAQMRTALRSHSLSLSAYTFDRIWMNFRVHNARCSRCKSVVR